MSKQDEVSVQNVERHMKATIKSNQDDLNKLYEQYDKGHKTQQLESDIDRLEGRLSGQRAFLQLLEGR
jgi:hypothetical protein